MTRNEQQGALEAQWGAAATERDKETQQQLLKLYEVKVLCEF